MVQQLKLNYIPTTLNQYINSERTNRYVAAKIKKEETEKVAWLCKIQRLKPIKHRVKIEIVWYLKNKKRDPDNISFAKKFILDGLVLAKILPNDNMKYISGFIDIFKQDKSDSVLLSLVPDNTMI